MNTLDEVAKEVHLVRKNQELTMKMVRLILEELGLRKAITRLEEEMEEGHGSLAPASLDLHGE